MLGTQGIVWFGLVFYGMHDTIFCPISGFLLLMRVIAVTFCVTLAASMAARLGSTSMAAFQVCLQVWLATSLLADGLAVAGQVRNDLNEDTTTQFFLHLWMKGMSSSSSVSFLIFSPFSLLHFFLVSFSYLNTLVSLSL